MSVAKQDLIPFMRVLCGLGLMLVTPIAFASREGAGIGEGIALLVYGVLSAVALVIAVAIVSGIVIGLRRGTVGRQVARHLLYGLMFLLVTPFIAAAIGLIWDAFERAAYERNAATLDAWLAPLKQPATGNLDHALSLVLDAEDANTRSRRSYLIATLPSLLDRIEVPLDEQDRTAVQAAVNRLRLENEQLKVGSHPSNLDRIDAAAAWLLHKPDLPTALLACQDRPACSASVLESADGWCYRHRETCPTTLDPARLEAAEALVRSDRYALQWLQRLRTRATGG